MGTITGRGEGPFGRQSTDSLYDMPFVALRIECRHSVTTEALENVRLHIQY